MRRYLGDSEADMANNKLVALVVLIAVLFTLHIADHALRGDISWPTTWEAVAGLGVNAGIFALIALGLVLYTHGRIGPGPWAIAALFGLAFGWLGHFSPFTEQPPQYIYACYTSPVAGWLALACLFALMATLAITLVYATLLWIRQRNEGEGIA
jgi:hypothetical protein